MASLYIFSCIYQVREKFKGSRVFNAIPEYGLPLPWKGIEWTSFIAFLSRVNVPDKAVDVRPVKFVIGFNVNNRSRASLILSAE